MQNSADILGIFGGGFASVTAVRALCAQKIGPVWAADGGADLAVRAGFQPEKIIGDGDSLSSDARLAFADRLVIDRDQNTTDLDKVIARLPDILAIGIGFLGGRLDHSLAALSSLARNPHARIILLSDENCLCLLPESLDLDIPEGTLLGVYPLAPARAQSEGLKWELTGLELSPLGQIGTSNQAAGNGVSFRNVEGPLFLTLPLEMLGALVDRFSIQAG